MRNPLATVSEAAKLGIFSFLIFGILLIAYLYETHLEEREAAIKDSWNFSWALSEQARGVFEAADEALIDMEEDLAESDFSCGKLCSSQPRAKQIHDLLHNANSHTKVLDLFNIHDVHGDLIYSSKEPLPVVNNSDRPYFQEIKSHPELVRVFSDPLISRTTKKPTIIFARRFLSKQGKFIGTMQANVGMEQFISVYKSLNLGPHSVISMRTVNGFHRMARYPTVTEEQEPATKTLNHPLKVYLDKKLTQGTLDVVSPTDGIKRTVSFHKIGNYPFYIEVGFAVKDYEAGWRIRAILLSLVWMMYGGIAFFFVRKVGFTYIDALTKLFNRRKFDEVLLLECERARRTQSPLTVIIADIDKFKSVNDIYGHQAGDQLLVAVAGILQQGVRKLDMVVRWGGEEFVILCPSTNLHGACALAEKIRIDIENHDFATVGVKTCSFGVAEFHPDERPEDVIKRADEALYRAKNGGRNRVCSG